MSRIYVPVQVDRFLGYRSDLAATVAEPGWATELLNAVINHLGWLETRAGRKNYSASSTIQLALEESGNEEEDPLVPRTLGVAPIYGARAIALRTVRFYGQSGMQGNRVYVLAHRPLRFVPYRDDEGLGGRILEGSDTVNGVGSTVIQIDYPVPRIPTTNWQVWATVPSDQWKLHVDPLRIGKWAERQRYDDPIMGERIGLYCINLAPLGDNGLILGLDTFGADNIIQFWAYRTPEGELRLLYAPIPPENTRNQLTDLGGIGYYRFPMGTGQWIVVPDIYNGDYRIGWTTYWFYKVDSMGRRYANKRTVLTALSNHTGEFPAPLPLLVPPDEKEEVEWGLGLYRFALPRARQKVSSPEYRPYLGSPDRQAARLSTKPDGTALLQFWEALALTGESEPGAALKTTTVPGVFVDTSQPYIISNGDGSEYVDVAAPVSIEDAADVYVWEDVKTKYKLVWKGNPEVLEVDKEAEEIARNSGGVIVRTTKKKLTESGAREYYFEYQVVGDKRTDVATVGSAVPLGADLSDPLQRNLAIAPDYYVKPRDLSIGQGKIQQKRTGVRRRPFPRTEGETEDLPMAMWRYRFMWEFEDGSFSAVSHPVVAYDTLWSAVDDETLLALRLRHIASRDKYVASEDVFEQSPRLTNNLTATPEFPDAHLAARPYNALRGIVDLLRPSLTLAGVVFDRNTMQFSPVPMRQVYTAPRYNTRANAVDGTIQVFRWDAAEALLARYWGEYLRIRSLLYPAYHKLIRGTPSSGATWLEIQEALRAHPDLLVTVTSVIEKDGIVTEYVIAEGATHEGYGPSVSPLAPTVTDRELVVPFKLRNVAKLVIPVFPRAGYPGWQRTLCTSDGWIRLGYQWGSTWTPNWASPDDWDARFAAGRGGATYPLLRAAALADVRRSGSGTSWEVRSIAPSAMLVLPGRYRSFRIGPRDSSNYYPYTLEQDADFVEQHMADGIWLNIIGVDDIFGYNAAWESLGQPLGPRGNERRQIPTPFKVVRSELDSLSATSNIPPEVRERLIVEGYVELPLVRKGQYVAIAPEWLANGDNLGLSAGEGWLEKRQLSSDRWAQRVHEHPALPTFWARGDQIAAFDISTTGRQKLLDNLKDFRVFTDYESSSIHSPAPLYLRRRILTGDEAFYEVSGVAENAPDRLFTEYEPAVINNMEVWLYLPATRLLLHEQLTAAFPASLLFGAPRYRVVIPAEQIPEGAVRLWVFRTRAILDNQWEDEEYGVAARIPLEDRERLEGVDWLDIVKDDELDFSVDWRDYMFRRANLRSCFAAEVNGITYYGHLITRDFTGNMGEPSRYWGLTEDELRSSIYSYPIPTFQGDSPEDIPLAIPAPNQQPLPLGLSGTDMQRISRAAPAYIRYHFTDGPRLGNNSDIVLQLHPSRELYRSAHRLAPDKFGLLTTSDLADPRGPANTGWTSLLSNFTLLLYTSRRTSGAPRGVRKWRVYEVLYRNAETPEWGWIAARWLVSPLTDAPQAHGAPRVAIVGIPVHRALTTGFRTLVREYTLRTNAMYWDPGGALSGENFQTVLQGERIEIEEIREWELTDPHGVWHEELSDYVQIPADNMYFRALPEGAGNTQYRFELRVEMPGATSERAEPVQSELLNYEPDAIAWSIPGVPHNIPEGNILRVGQNVGGGITGLGVRESELVVFKRSAIFRLSLLPDNPNNPIGRIDEISNSIGCLAPATICRVGQDIFFLSGNGIAALTGATVRTIDDPVNAEITWRLNRAAFGVQGYRELATAAFYGARNAYVLCLPISRYDDPMFVEARLDWDESEAPNLMEWHSLAGEMFVLDLQRRYVTKFQFNLPGEDDFTEYPETRVYRREERKDLYRLMLLDSPLGTQLIGIDFFAPRSSPRAAFPEHGAPLLCNFSILWRQEIYEDRYIYDVETRQYTDSNGLRVMFLQNTLSSGIPIRFFWRSPWLLLGALSDKRLRRVDIWVEPLALRATVGHVTPEPFYRSGRLRIRSLHVSRRTERPVGGNLTDHSLDWRAEGWIPSPPRTVLLWAQPFDTQRVPRIPTPNLQGNNIVTLHDLVWRDRTISLRSLVELYGNHASRVFPRGSVWEIVVDLPRFEYVSPDIRSAATYRSRGGVDAGREVGIAFAVEVENWGYTILRGYQMYIRQVKSYLP